MCENTQELVNSKWKEALSHINDNLNDDSIKIALNSLSELNGVGIPTASALLTAWNPMQFGILDFKVLKVLKMKELYSGSSYVDYRKKLLELKKLHSELSRCTLRQIELALWHYYSIQETGPKEWSAIK